MDNRKLLKALKNLEQELIERLKYVRKRIQELQEKEHWV